MKLILRTIGNIHITSILLFCKMDSLLNPLEILNSGAGETAYGKSTWCIAGKTEIQIRAPLSRCPTCAWDPALEHGDRITVASWPPA